VVAEPGRGSLERSEELRAITERLWAATRRGDSDAVVARKSRVGGVTMFGPDAGEFIDDADHFAQYIRLFFKDNPTGFPQIGLAEIDAWVEGSVGWSISRVRIERSGVTHEQRLTLVFHLEHGDWRIVHEHWSFGAPAASAEAWGQTSARTLELLSQAAEQERPDISAWTSGEGTVTLVLTDIEGSTALNLSFGDRAWLQVLRAHNEVVTSATVEHGGTVVKGLGDGFILAFSSARRALACAEAIERRIGDTFTDPGSPIRVRIGVHIGEVVSEADDLFGHALNYATRVAAAASGGEILVSSLVHDLLDKTGEFAFHPPRNVELKGINGPARVYPLAPHST
jgi:class 3 adenylate cyclase